ncbi:MAG: DNA polymerase III subunit delta, partial [Gemmatales bacterium]|nr:DNA polymerase III subunit delta [Gemmatales bacterium]MDW8386539.1 DNA polymerase III subunit delta [Gemmatales bacterium]
MNAFEFLEGRLADKPLSVYVVTGDERFLKTEVLSRLKSLVLGTAESEFALSTRDGDAVSFADVQDELATLPFLAPRRLVVLREADGFVTRFREQLEKYCQRPAPHGVLVLDVNS